MENRGLQWIRGPCIGEGSFGTVTLATSRSNGQIFAVKSVNSKFAGSCAVGSLENEIQTLKSLTCPYIVRYLGDDWTHGTERNLHMEYVAGGTLADLAAESELDEHVIRHYTRCILQALLYIHSKGIIHCDIKGKNVLVDPTGTVKLADFGAARRVSGEAVGGSRGTPLWMAPEVVRLEAQSPESDVWSLGCTVIEMITGKPPWTVEDHPAAATMLLIGSGDGLPEFPDRLSELGKDFLHKCLRRRAGERWTASQLLNHPFISDVRIKNPSPRSVLDMINFSFQESRDADGSDYGDEEVSFDSVSNFSSSENNRVNSARERIRRLATDREIDWDRDGWEVVRLSTVIVESGKEEEATRDGDERERISLEYFNASFVGEGSCEGNVSFSGGMCRVMSSSCWGCDCCGLLGVGLSCQHGSKKRPLGMNGRRLFSRCNLYFVLLIVEMQIFLFFEAFTSGTTVYYFFFFFFSNTALTCTLTSHHVCKVPNKLTNGGLISRFLWRRRSPMQSYQQIIYANPLVAIIEVWHLSSAKTMSN